MHTIIDLLLNKLPKKKRKQSTIAHKNDKNYE